MHEITYSILRLIPNAQRQEVINIGVVLLQPNGVQIRLLKKYGKIKALCPNFQLDLFPTLEEDIGFLLSGTPDYEEVKRAFEGLGGFQLGPERSLSYINSHSINIEVERLMRKYVYPETNLADRHPAPLFQCLRQQLSELTPVSSSRELRINSGGIAEWYPLDEHGWLRADFACSAADRMIFIQAVDLQVSDRRELVRAIGYRRLIGEQARKKFPNNSEIWVTYRLSQRAKELGANELLSLLEEYADELWDYNDPTQGDLLREKMTFSLGPNLQLPLAH